MTHAIRVPTPFTDIGELAEDFASRVDEERLVLPHHEPIGEGEWVQFSVTFADGSGALVGVGRCTGCYDAGEDRAPEHRYDVVMDSLDLDEIGQVYLERILQVRAARMGAEPQTGELSVEEVEAAFASAEEPYEPGAAELAEAPTAEAAEPAADAAAYAEPAEYEDATAYAEPAPPYDDAGSDWVDPGHTQVGDASELLAQARGERLAAPVEAIYALPPPTRPGELPSPHANGAVLTRRVLPATWSPEPAPRPDPSPSSGLFQYGDGGLPQPSQPPRPPLDPSLRVTRAPRPGDPLAVPASRAAPAFGGAAAVAGEEPAYDASAYTDELATQEGDTLEHFEEAEPDYSELPDSAYGTGGEETVQVEMPGEDER